MTERKISEIKERNNLLTDSIRSFNKLKGLERSIEKDYKAVLIELDNFFLTWQVTKNEYKGIRKAGERGLFSLISRWNQDSRLPPVVRTNVIILNRLDTLKGEIEGIKSRLSEMTNGYENFDLRLKTEYLRLKIITNKFDERKNAILKDDTDKLNRIQSAINQSIQNSQHNDLPQTSNLPEWFNPQVAAIVTGATIGLAVLGDYAQKETEIFGSQSGIIEQATKGLSEDQKAQIPTILNPDRFSLKGLDKIKQVGDRIENVGALARTLSTGEGNSNAGSTINEAYFGHRDPGNHVCNVGIYSVQTYQLTLERLSKATGEQQTSVKNFEKEYGTPISQVNDCDSETTRKLFIKHNIPAIASEIYLAQWIKPFEKELKKDFEKYKITPTTAEVLRAFDLFIQSPAAAKEYVKRLNYLYNEVIPGLEKLKGKEVEQKAFIQKSLGGITNLPDYNGKNHSISIEQLLTKDTIAIANLAAILSFNPSLDQEAKVEKFKVIYDAGGLNNYNAGRSKEEVAANMLTDRSAKYFKVSGATGLTDEDLKARISTVIQKPESIAQAPITQEAKKERDVNVALFMYGEKRLKQFQADPSKVLKEMTGNNVKSLAKLTGQNITDADIKKAEKEIEQKKKEIEKIVVEKATQYPDLDMREIKDTTKNKETGLNEVQTQILEKMKKSGVDLSKYDTKSEGFWNDLEIGKLNVYNLGIKDNIVESKDLKSYWGNEAVMKAGDPNNMRTNANGTPRGHDGTDSAVGENQVGNPIPAISAGRVVKSITPSNKEGYSVIVIQTPTKLVYELHLKPNNNLKVGDIVFAGTNLGGIDGYGGVAPHRHTTFAQLATSQTDRKMQIDLVKSNQLGGGTSEWNRFGITSPTVAVARANSYIFTSAKRDDLLAKSTIQMEDSSLVGTFERDLDMPEGSMTQAIFQILMKNNFRVPEEMKKTKIEDPKFKGVPELKTPDTKKEVIKDPKGDKDKKDEKGEKSKDKSKDKKVSLLPERPTLPRPPMRTLFPEIARRNEELSQKYATNQTISPIIG